MKMIEKMMGILKEDVSKSLGRVERAVGSSLVNAYCTYMNRCAQRAYRQSLRETPVQYRDSEPTSA